MFKNYPVLYALLLAAVISCGLNAQKLQENKIDEFTKALVRRTNWIDLHKKKGSWRPHKSVYQVERVNNTININVKMMLNNTVYSVNEGDAMMFLMTDGTVVTLKNKTYQLTTYGVGAPGYVGSDNLGTECKYEVTNEDIKLIQSGIIKKIRIYTSQGYVEQNDDENVSKTLKKALDLVLTE